MVSLPFLPMTIVLLYAVFIRLADKEYRCGALLLLLFLLPAAALFTPVYMVFILLVGLGRLVKPQIGWNERVLCGLLDAWNVEEFKGFVPPMLRMVEVVGESYPQALLGESSFTWLIQHHRLHHHHNHSPPPSRYRFLLIIIIIMVTFIIISVQRTNKGSIQNPENVSTQDCSSSGSSVQPRTKLSAISNFSE